jgi:hypothetical protein
MLLAKVVGSVVATRKEPSLAPAPVTGHRTSVDVEVFTTRLDTIYGATFVLIAPEHELVEQFARESDDAADLKQRADRFLGLPHRSIREAIALAIHLVAHVARVGNRRRVIELVAVRGYDGEADRFLLDQRYTAGETSGDRS